MSWNSRSLCRPFVTRVRSWASPLNLYLSTVSVVGVPVAVWAVAASVRDASDGPYASLLVATLVVVLAIGEFLPIHVSRKGRRTDEITISSTFAFALVLIAPLGLVVLAQTLPLVLDDLRRGKRWSRPVFNSAQYALSFSLSRLTFCALTDQEFFVPEFLSPADLPAAAAAGITFLLVNHGLVGVAVALSSSERVVSHLIEDLLGQLSTSGLLISLGPLVVTTS